MDKAIPGATPWRTHGSRRAWSGSGARAGSSGSGRPVGRGPACGRVVQSGVGLQARHEMGPKIVARTSSVGSTRGRRQAAVPWIGRARATPAPDGVRSYPPRVRAFSGRRAGPPRARPLWPHAPGLGSSSMSGSLMPTSCKIAGGGQVGGGPPVAGRHRELSFPEPNGCVVADVKRSRRTSRSPARRSRRPADLADRHPLVDDVVSRHVVASGSRPWWEGPRDDIPVEESDALIKSARPSGDRAGSTLQAEQRHQTNVAAGDLLRVRPMARSPTVEAAVAAPPARTSPTPGPPCSPAPAGSSTTPCASG
jgi:hypothetical protein